MKSKLWMIALVSFSLSSPIVYAIESTQTTEPSQTMSTQTAATNNQNTQETLEWLVVLNKNEIAVSKEVLKRNKLDPAVKQYAEYLVSQHTQLLKDTMQLSQKLKEKPVISSSSTDLQKQGDDALSKLKSLDSKDLQKTYIDAMVQGHTEALSALQQYIASENNAALKKLLEVTEKHVSMHLEKAKEIQKKYSL